MKNSHNCVGNRQSCMPLSHPFPCRLQGGYCVFITVYFQGLRDFSKSKFRSVQEIKHAYLSASLASSAAEYHTIYTKPESHSALMADAHNFMSWQIRLSPSQTQIQFKVPGLASLNLSVPLNINLHQRGWKLSTHLFSTAFVQKPTHRAKSTMPGSKVHPPAGKKKKQNGSRLEIHRKERSKSILFYTRMKSSAQELCNQPLCSKQKIFNNRVHTLLCLPKTCTVKAKAVLLNH